MTSPALTVRTLTPEQHLDFLRTWTADGGAASFLQTPAWGAVKSEWRRESIGWFDPSNRLVGAGLVLYRQLPKVKRYLAYLPEGPVLDWDAEDLRAYLNPMVRHLKKAGAFGVRMGPPVVTRRWDAAFPGELPVVGALIGGGCGSAHGITSWCLAGPAVSPSSLVAFDAP